MLKKKKNLLWGRKWETLWTETPNCLVLALNFHSKLIVVFHIILTSYKAASRWWEFFLSSLQKPLSSLVQRHGWWGSLHIAAGADQGHRCIFPSFSPCHCLQGAPSPCKVSWACYLKIGTVAFFLAILGLGVLHVLQNCNGEPCWQLACGGAARVPYGNPLEGVQSTGSIGWLYLAKCDTGLRMTRYCLTSNLVTNMPL